MLETTPLIPDLMPESTVTDKGFQSVLDYIDEVSRTPHQKGELFERLMQVYSTKISLLRPTLGEIGRRSKGLNGPIPGLTSLHRRLTADTALSSVNATVTTHA